MAAEMGALCCGGHYGIIIGQLVRGGREGGLPDEWTEDESALMSPRVFLRFPIHCIRNYGYSGMGLHKDPVPIG